jgi:PKD repeat protein
VEGQPVKFEGTSTGNPASWHWDFGDGSTSTEQNPVHIFAKPGFCKVTLTARVNTVPKRARRTVVIMPAPTTTTSSPAFPTGGQTGRTYWVSPTGTAAWADARSEKPLSGSACSPLSTANRNAVAGDTVILRDGTYSTGINPSNSGSEGNVITFMAYKGEIPRITVGNERAVTIVGKSYIKVDGIHSYESQAFFFIGYGACYNEIANCVFDRSWGQYSIGLISCYSTALAEGGPSNHNWIHHNVFSRYGRISNGDDLGTIRISGHRTDPSAYNTFENNVFFYGGHDCLDIGGRYNVVRNNVFHNEEAYFEVPAGGECRKNPASGYFGNRNIILSNYGDGPGTAFRTLIEGNRIGHAGTAPDDNGGVGIENAGAHTVVRYNDIYGNGSSGYYSKMQGAYDSSVRSGSWARVYNNSIYHNGFGDPEIDVQFKHGICIWSYRTYNDWPEDVVVVNNIVYGNRNEWRVGSENILPQITYKNNFNSNPGFVNEYLYNKSSLNLPNLQLLRNSPCIDRGTYLTAATGSGSNSTTLVVDDALFFQDGSWGSSLSKVQADWIAIGTVNNVVQIKSIDYGANVITLEEPMTWNAQAPIWLFRNSRGKDVLLGTAPDIGAHEYSLSFIPR